MSFPYRYRVLALLAVVAGLVAYNWRGIWVIDAFAANISAGFIGALIIVALVDRAAELREEERRSRVERVALQQARTPLYELIATFRDMIKASLAESPASPPTTWRSLFDTNFTDQLDWLNLTGNCGRLGHRDWYGYLSVFLPKVSADLSHVIDKYAVFLDVEFVEDLEAVRQNNFLSLLPQIGYARNHGLAQGRNIAYSITGMSAMWRPLFERLVKVIEYHDAKSDEPLTPPGEEFTRNDIAPPVGSCRLAALPQAPEPMMDRQAPNGLTRSYL